MKKHNLELLKIYLNDIDEYNNKINKIKENINLIYKDFRLEDLILHLLKIKPLSESELINLLNSYSIREIKECRLKLAISGKIKPNRKWKWELVEEISDE